MGPLSQDQGGKLILQLTNYTYLTFIDSKLRMPIQILKSFVGIPGSWYTLQEGINGGPDCLVASLSYYLLSSSFLLERLLWISNIGFISLCRCVCYCCCHRICTICVLDQVIEVTDDLPTAGPNAVFLVQSGSQLIKASGNAGFCWVSVYLGRLWPPPLMSPHTHILLVTYRGL